MYNTMFAFMSPAAKVDKTINNGKGPPTIHIQGQPCHRIGSLLPPSGGVPKFAQLYIYDIEHEVQNKAVRYFHIYVFNIFFLMIRLFVFNDSFIYLFQISLFTFLFLQNCFHTFLTFLYIKNFIVYFSFFSNLNLVPFSLLESRMVIKRQWTHQRSFKFFAFYFVNFQTNK